MAIERPDPAWARFWYVTYALTLIVLLPIDLWWEAWGAIATDITLFGFGLFLGAEGTAAYHPDHPGFDDTKTEFTYWKVTNPVARFILGVAMAVALYVRLPGLMGPIVGIPMAAWLPAHLTWFGWEKRFWLWLKAKFS